MGEIQNDRIVRFTEKVTAERETLDEMAQRVADGETLVEVCAAWDIPHSRFAAWLGAEESRRAQYQAALKARADALVAETIKIADGAPPRVEEHTMKDGRVVPVVILPDHNRDKLAVGTRFRAAEKWDPARFGTVDAAPPPVRRSAASVPILEAARQVAFAMAQGAHIVETQRRAPRLLEGTVVAEPVVAPTPASPPVAEPFDDGP